MFRVRARLPYPIGPLEVFAMAVPVVARARALIQAAAASNAMSGDHDKPLAASVALGSTGILRAALYDDL
jgi:hypothetical protein